MSVKGSPCMFGPEELRAEIVGQWGPAGAHVEVFDDLLRRVEVAERRYTDMTKRGTWKEAQEYSEYWRLVAEKAERELDEEREDSARLDWLDARQPTFAVGRGPSGEWAVFGPTNIGGCGYSDVRAAIDAERGRQ